MNKKTRFLFNSYLATIAALNGVESTAQTFAVEPVVEQKFEEKLKENVEFLGAISIENVSDQAGQTLGLESASSIMGRTNTANNTRRQPVDPTDNGETNTYFCKQTDFDWSRSYPALDKWRHKPEFERLLAMAILKQQGRDLIMCGWHGTSRAAQTDRGANPLLQDVNEGWLHKIRTNAPAQVFDDGSLTVHTDGSNDDATKAIYIKAGAELFDANAALGDAGSSNTAEADYSSIDAMVLDAQRFLPEWHADDTGLVVIVGRNLLDDKYFNIAQATGATATEVEATDRILRSTKTIGNLPAMRVPFFPANAILITRLDNLAIYNQEGTRRRRLADEPEYNRIANYESVNMDYVVEDYELAVLVENISMGAAPARPAP
ncbi:MAG: phage major capsid protein, P2 family [Caenibius sp.]